MAQVGLKHSRHAANKYIDATIATLTDESKRKLVNPENLEGARAAYSTGELERKTYESHDPNTNTMQTIIKEDDINPYELLRPQTGPITNEDDAGFSMLFVYNLIEL